jgi:hypothetical protein
MATRGASAGAEAGVSGFNAWRWRNARTISQAISEAQRSETVSTVDLLRQTEVDVFGNGRSECWFRLSPSDAALRNKILKKL